MSTNLYTQEQMDIALLKNTNEGILGTLQRMEQKTDANLHWTIALMFGLYAMVITGLVGAIGHAYGWF